MKKEFGKWVLDVAKYVATAVIISNLFSDMHENAILAIGGICVILMLILGLLLIREPKDKKKK